MATQTRILNYQDVRRESRRSASPAAGRSRANSPSSRSALQATGSRRPSANVSRSSASAARRPQGAARSHAAQPLRKKSGPVSFIQNMQRSQRKRKASRQFEKNVATRRAPEESGTRAALHQGAMGSRQRRASRMHAERSAYSTPGRGIASGASGIAGFFSSALGGFMGRRHGKLFNFGVFACITLLLAVIFLYPAGKDLYTAVRDTAKSEAEYAALQEYYTQLEDQVAALDAETGVEDAIRSRYGWVKNGENGILVQGVQGDNSFDVTQAGIVPSGSIKAPTTWYSVVLDPFFGYQG